MWSAGTVGVSGIVDTLRATPLLPGGSIIAPPNKKYGADALIHQTFQPYAPGAKWQGSGSSVVH